MSEQCPIWGTSCEVSLTDFAMRTGVDDRMSCRSLRAGGRYKITRNAVINVKEWTEQENFLKAKLSRWIYKKNFQGELPEVTSQILEEVEHWPVPSVPKRMDYLLEFIDSKAERIDEPVPWSDEMQAATLSMDEKELRYLIGQAKKSDWIEMAAVADCKNPPLVITIQGYKHLEKLGTVQVHSDQAFVAMWFDEEMDEAWEKGFKPGIVDAGYKWSRADLEQHNDKIDDEIIAGIRRSRFLVADFTSKPKEARGGVYYEAGFAQGLNIPVIFTCRRDIFESDDIHFDTRQFNHIVWDDPEDLRKQLKNRIAATIGDGPNLNHQKPA